MMTKCLIDTKLAVIGLDKNRQSIYVTSQRTIYNQSKIQKRFLFRNTFYGITENDFTKRNFKLFKTKC